MEPIAYRVADAARVIGISRSRLYELIQDGSLEARKVGGCTLIPANALRALIDKAPLKAVA